MTVTIEHRGHYYLTTPRGTSKAEYADKRGWSSGGDGGSPWTSGWAPTDEQALAAGLIRLLEHLYPEESEQA